MLNEKRENCFLFYSYAVQLFALIYLIQFNALNDPATRSQVVDKNYGPPDYVLIFFYIVWFDLMGVIKLFSKQRQKQN